VVSSSSSSSSSSINRLFCIPQLLVCHTLACVFSLLCIIAIAASLPPSAGWSRGRCRCVHLPGRLHLLRNLACRPQARRRHLPPRSTLGKPRTADAAIAQLDAAIRRQFEPHERAAHQRVDGWSIGFCR
jgi:hypothetical protein